MILGQGEEGSGGGVLAFTFWGHAGDPRVSCPGAGSLRAGCGPSQQSRACAGSVTLTLHLPGSGRGVSRDSLRAKGTGHHVGAFRESPEVKLLSPSTLLFQNIPFFLPKKKKDSFFLIKESSTCSSNFSCRSCC